MLHGNSSVAVWIRLRPSIHRPKPILLAIAADDTDKVQTLNATESVKFFTLADRGLSTSGIEKMFSTESFFSLPDEIEATVPWSANNAGLKEDM
ncbi:hypothetical protein ALT_9075 [Aspergillus lentulus]|uniref:Uncharacterized protein n=1 Tax=Aspergillus lentulus TaxID=293939 RepID=A0AAN4PSY1_ASPLE|nr:hypothetical protein ALT_9075 [Aspergillus lentulus]